MQYTNRGEVFPGVVWHETLGNGRPSRGRIALVSHLVAYRGLVRGLAERGFDVDRYQVNCESTSRLQQNLGELASRLARHGPNAVVACVDPVVHEPLVGKLNGAIPLVLLSDQPSSLTVEGGLTVVRGVSVHSTSLAPLLSSLIERAQELRAKE